MLWGQLIRRVEAVDPDKVNECFLWADNLVRKSLVKGEHYEGFAADRLARVMLFYALSIADAKRTQRRSKAGGRKQSGASINSPDWTQLKREIAEFVESAPESIAPFLCKSTDGDKVAQFATLTSRSQGVRDSNFYITLVLFMIWKGNKNAFSTGYFQRLASRDDQGFPAHVLSLLGNYLQFGIPTASPEPQKEIRVRFNVKDDNTNRFQNFHEHFDIGSRSSSESHFVVYRTMRSNPCALMKSFLSIREPSGVFEEKDSFLFSHFYHPPDKTGQVRFSGGKLLPLDEAVYLVGGQRPDRPDSKSIPFNSIKTLAFKWHDIEQRHALFPAMVLSSNYRGEAIVARTAVRVTPMDHSSLLSLGKVNLHDLEEDLRKDFEAEQHFLDAFEAEQTKLLDLDPTVGKLPIPQDVTADNAIEASDWPDRIFVSKRTHFIVEPNDGQVTATADQIKRLTNNAPNSSHGWDVPSTFIRGEGAKAQRLTKEQLAFIVSKALETGKSNEFKNSENESFDLWRHTRFGPISIG